MSDSKVRKPRSKKSRDDAELRRVVFEAALPQFEAVGPQVACVSACGIAAGTKVERD